MQPVKSLTFLLAAIVIGAIPSPVSSQNLPPTATEPSDDEPETEVTEPISEPETLPPTQTPPSNSQYYIAPRIAPDEKINPFTTTLPLNNISISHQTNWEVFVNPTFGENFEQDVGYGGILKLHSRVKESLSRDNIFQTDQIGTYLQLQSVRNRREINVTAAAKETLLGLELKMSLIGACLFGEGEPTDRCSYTPGLVIDRDSIDSGTLAPTKVFNTSKVGDIVTPESWAVMQQPGFQRGANGQELGVDLYFPNVGTISRENSIENSSIERQEKIELIPVGIFSRIRQVVKANATEAVIGRTVKGAPLIIENGQTLLTSSLASASFLLPDAIPDLAGSEAKFNPNVNQNLFFAANNTRLPSDSFTIYHAGWGKARSISAEVKNTSQIPSGRFNGVWLGLSPVVELRSENFSYYKPTGKIGIIADVGAEGGTDSDVHLISIVNGEEFASSALQNVHTQIYLKFFAQEADVVTVSSLKEKTNYDPHLSFTGNITDSQNVTRYYTGVIFNKPLKVYLGADYNHNTFSGWKFSAGGYWLY